MWNILIFIKELKFYLERLCRSSIYQQNRRIKEYDAHIGHFSTKRCTPWEKCALATDFPRDWRSLFSNLKDRKNIYLNNPEYYLVFIDCRLQSYIFLTSLFLKTCPGTSAYSAYTHSWTLIKVHYRFQQSSFSKFKCPLFYFLKENYENLNTSLVGLSLLSLFLENIKETNMD